MKAWSKELKSLSDAQLVQCFVGGNNRCFDEIVVRHHAHIHSFLHYKLHHPELEKDAEQDTFITAYAEIRTGHYQEHGHLTQYLNSIAFHEAMLLLRTEHHYVHDDTALRTDEQQEEPEEEIFIECAPDTALSALP